MKKLLYSALLLVVQQLPMAQASPTGNLLVTKKISTGWQLRQVGKDQWYPATVPGTVNTDLLKNKLINDPFYGERRQSSSGLAMKPGSIEQPLLLMPLPLIGRA